MSDGGEIVILQTNIRRLENRVQALESRMTPKILGSKCKSGKHDKCKWKECECECHKK